MITHSGTGRTIYDEVSNKTMKTEATETRERQKGDGGGVEVRRPHLLCGGAPVSVVPKLLGGTIEMFVIVRIEDKTSPIYTHKEKETTGVYTLQKTHDIIVTCFHFIYFIIFCLVFSVQCSLVP